MAAPMDSSVTTDIGWRFDNSYARLPQRLFAQARPAYASAPRVMLLNTGLADALGLSLGALSPDGAAALFSGQAIPAGAQPIAQAYAGHQFGGFTMLGDGRAILLGEHLAPDGSRVDIQFKGSGQTPYSRRGDGRAALGPMLREFVISEAMHALGIPTTRSLAVVATGDPVYREERLKGAVLTRVAASHLRVGTFEFLAAHGDHVALRALADYTIKRHYPAAANAANPYLAFYQAVLERQMALIVQWQLVGFVHGVMNTDNMSIAGETIDYGPCAFMDRYDPGAVFSSIDAYGRYAYDQQPLIAQWNLARFADALLPLLDPVPDKAIELATEVLSSAGARFDAHWLAGMRAKLGLSNAMPGDDELARELFMWMHTAAADFTNTFRALATGDAALLAPASDQRFAAWHARWRGRIAAEGVSLETAQQRMRAASPVIIPRNQRVEETLAAAEQDDMTVMHRLLEALATPYDDRPRDAAYLSPAPEDSERYRTFCGT